MNFGSGTQQTSATLCWIVIQKDFRISNHIYNNYKDNKIAF